MDSAAVDAAEVVVLVIQGLGEARLRSYRPRVHGGRPTLAIEGLSDSNTAREMLDKLVFHDSHGVTQYLVCDPHSGRLLVWEREGAHLVPVTVHDGWTNSCTGDLPHRGHRADRGRPRGTPVAPA